MPPKGTHHRQSLRTHTISRSLSLSPSSFLSLCCARRVLKFHSHKDNNDVKLCIYTFVPYAYATPWCLSFMPKSGQCCTHAEHHHGSQAYTHSGIQCIQHINVYTCNVARTRQPRRQPTKPSFVLSLSFSISIYLVWSSPVCLDVIRPQYSGRPQNGPRPWRSRAPTSSQWL